MAFEKMSGPVEFGEEGSADGHQGGLSSGQAIEQIGDGCGMCVLAHEGAEEAMDSVFHFLIQVILLPKTTVWAQKTTMVDLPGLFPQTIKHRKPPGVLEATS